MKKSLVLAVLVLAILGPVFGQEEYTLFYSGIFQGIITIQKDRGGKITVSINVDSEGIRAQEGVTIDPKLCPLLPASFWIAKNYTRSIIIDGNTTTEIASNGWIKTVVNGNTTTTTSSSGDWEKMIVDGNTKISTT
ncbi:hypothetical protein AGMMS50230_18340 [Spirochaetia bacterium]|nr:hypothetical protein AGMMS50230_18340 [Spirochaetia bacterium]